MASREDWCADKLSKLLQEDLRISTLHEIKDHLESLSHDEASHTANTLQLPLVFDCLNDSNREQVDLACEVLSLCMSNLNVGESTDKYEAPLERALNHPYSGVKLMALNEISRNITNEKALRDLIKRSSLFHCVVRCIGDEDIAVAKKASDVVTSVGSTPQGLKLLLSNESLAIVNEVMAINEVVRLRFYEIIINISNESESNLKMLGSTGLVSLILEDLNNNDVLLRMNIVELLSQFGSSSHGYNYLEQNGILDKLFSVLEDDDDLLTVQLCEPGILKFFGHMAARKPQEMLYKYPKMFDRLFDNLEKSDITIVSVSLDTLGLIGSSNEGKFALHSTGNRITYAIKNVVKVLPCLPTEVRVRALCCLENLLRVREKSSDIIDLTENWYNVSCDDLMEVILKYVKNPFAEIKLAGLGILQAVAEQPWGQNAIKDRPGLVEYLLDRNVDTGKECKEAKYEIIKSLANSNSFDQITLRKLQKYVKEGPFHVQPITDVATEGND